jgi:peptidyl-prolyl cis-trans isomerase D
MLQVIRNFISSKIGAAIALGVLVLIAIAFTSGDVSNTGTFGGVTGGDRVALVGGERIDNATLSQSATTMLERARQEQPGLTMKTLLADGGIDHLVDQLADRLAIAVYGRQYGIVASDRLVDSEIAKDGGFRGADGKFSESLFRQAIRQRGIGEQKLRDDIKTSLIAQQILIPASFGAVMPEDLTMRYAGLVSETREGVIAVLPSLQFAPKDKPADKQLADYYAKNEDDFIRPERRVIRYVGFDTSIVAGTAAATDAEIAARYKENAAQYKASETRSFSQLVVPTEAAAKAIAEEIAKGSSLEAAASKKGLSVAKIAATEKAALERQASKAVSDAAFAVPAGKVAPPARSALGWHIMRVENITSKPARSLADVRAELAEKITREKQALALAERLEEIEDELDGRASLVDMAKEVNAEVMLTQPLTADGKVYGKVGQEAPALLKTVIDTAFVMDQERPQLAIIDRGVRFVIYDVTEITPSAPAPLKEIKDVQVQAKVRKGETLQTAMTSIKERTLPPQPVRMSRPELMQIQAQGQGVPAPIALMFQMAQGTVKVQAADDGQAWFIVQLRKIEPAKIKKDDPSLATARKDLGRLAGDEYAQAMQRAILSEIGVEKNKAAIRAVREQLTGGN